MEKLLEVKNLKKYFPVERGFLRRVAGRVHAVDGVSFSVEPGETVGLVGESGCGKTTVAKLILRLIEPTSGEAIFEDKQLFAIKGEELRKLRRDFQIVFQDPYNSLNPRMKVKQIVGEPLIVHELARGKEDFERRIAELLESVGLRPAYKDRYPHEFSGGERQRIGVARALASRPKLIICDEPVSSLDLSIQAQVLNLLMELQHKFSLAYLFIAHNLRVIEHVSDRILVMYVGKIAESAPNRDLYTSPFHPYTRALLSAAYKGVEGFDFGQPPLKGELPSPISPPSGCRFRTRCPYAAGICREKEPKLRQIKENHFAACHRIEEIG